MSKGDRFWTVARKRGALKQADASGQIADSTEVRMRLIAEMTRGEKTLEQVQAELASIKRAARKNELRTRSQVYNQS